MLSLPRWLRNQSVKKCRTFKSRALYILLSTTVLATVYYVNTLRYFDFVLEKGDREVLLRMLKFIDTKLTAANVTYMLIDGSLLGSYRHHGIIPWDDDIDLWFDIQDVKIITKLFAEGEPEFKVYRQANGAMSWRLHPANTKYPKSTFPFIDVQFFLDNGTHMWPIQNYKTFGFYRLKSKMFPLRRRPFEDMMLPAPCDILHAIRDHDPDMCQRRAYPHKYETPTYVWQASMWPCSIIKNWLPFVERKRVNNGWKESLVSKGKVVNEFTQPDCSHG